MGCTGSETDLSSSQKMRMQMKRLKLQIGSKVQKIRGEALAQEKVLVKEFGKGKGSRAAAGEKAIATDIVMKMNKMQIFQIVGLLIQKIIDYSHHLDSEQKASESVMPSLRQVLYCQSILKDTSIDHFCSSVRRKYPQIKQSADQQIDSEIIRFHKKSQIPSSQMINDYLLKLINQESLDLNVVNSVGHGIKY